jgi:sugar/nucleoside kinase (ribokinase family)
MSYDVAGIGNALMDALVLVDDEQLVDELGLVRGTMHPVDHAAWEDVYARVKHLGVTLDSGGSCANVIATLGRLGAKVVYRGQVGDDELGRTYAARMIESCGHVALKVAPGHHTGKCLSIISRRDAERTMVTDLGAAITLEDLGDYGSVLASAGIAHFTGYTLLPGKMRTVIDGAMAQAKAGGARISLDVADPFVVAATKDYLWEILEKYTDIAFLNAEEARALTDEAPEKAARIVSERAHVRTVCVKLGSRGSIVFHDGVEYEIPIYKVKAVDTTGAGDAYAGGFLYGLSRRWPVEMCGHLGSRVAALAVAQIGAVVKDHALLAGAVSEVLENANDSDIQAIRNAGGFSAGSLDA